LAERWRIMSGDSSEEPFFEVVTPLGFSVRVSRAHSTVITTINIP
jgi:hypothetical protein